MKIDVSLLSKYNCKIKTDSGYQVVTETFIKSEKCYELHFSDWTILKVAENHLFELSSGEWKFAKDLADTDVVLCEQGEASIINKIDVGMQTVYDLTVDTNKHQYYLDGISSHNTGKNLIISSACCALMDRKSSPHEGIVYIRSNIDSIETKDQELGFLPGAIEEKMAPYLRPLKDTIDTLVRSKYKVAISKDREALDAKIEEFNEKYNISFEAMNFLRGGTIKNSLIIIDECQNISVSGMKLILTRVGENCKVFIMGDTQQIDSKYMSERNNGLTYMMNLVGTQEDIRIVGIDLTKTIRSKIAGWAADNM